MKEKLKKLFKRDQVFAKGICFDKLFIIFLIASVIGSLYEQLLNLFLVYSETGELVWEYRRGVIYGPFNVIYGFGAVLIIYLLADKKHKWYETILYGALLGGGIEYLIGFLQETFTQTISWDYSHKLLNINGRITLEYMFLWGFLAFLLVRYLYPFISKWIVYFQHIETVDFASALIGIASIVVIVLTPKISKKIPGSLVAIILMTVIVYIMRNYFGVSGIETIGDRFTINASLPEPNTITFDMTTINLLLPSAFTIAMLGAIESLLSATVADGVTGDKHNSNTELIAQGAANIVSPIFGGIPVTGAIARTMTNINNGGRTPVAGIIHAIVLLLILLFLGPLTKHIPMSCLAGVLVIVSYNMSDWRTFRSLMKNPKSDVSVLLVTFFLTVIFDLTIAIEVGLLIAMFLFMKRVAETTQVSVVKNQIDLSDEGEFHHDEEVLSLPKGVEVYEINGPFFFGIANKFDGVMHSIGDKPKLRIIRMRKVPFMDSTGLHNLESFYRLSTAENIQIILSGVNEHVRELLIKSGFDQKIGKENICSNISEAIKKAEEAVKG